MSISEIKSYLASRAATPPELLALSDADLQKYINTASLLLNTFYNFNEIKSEEAAIQIIGEEIIFLYTVNFDSKIKMTEARQAVMDAFQSNDNDAMSVNDIINIAHVGNAVVKGMIKSGALVESICREKTNNDFGL